MIKLRTPIPSTSALASVRNYTPQPEMSKISMVDAKSRLFLNIVPKTGSSKRIKVDFSSCEYHDDFKEMNTKSKIIARNDEEYTMYTLSPSKISKLKNSTKLYNQIRKSTSKKGENLLRVQTHNRFKSRQLNEDSIVQSSEAIERNQRITTDTSISNFLTTINVPVSKHFSNNSKSSTALKSSKTIAADLNDSDVIYREKCVKTENSKERDYSRFDKKIGKFVKSRNVGLKRNLARLKEETELNLKSEKSILSTESVLQLNSEINYLQEEVERLKMSNYEMKMELDQSKKKVILEKQENAKLRILYETAADNLHRLSQFKDQIEIFEKLFPNSSAEKIRNRLQESEQGYLNIAKEFMESEDALKRLKFEGEEVKRVFDSKSLELSKTRVQYESIVQELRAELITKDFELSSLKSYKNDYLSLSNRLIALFAAWQSKNKAFFSDEGKSQDDVSLETPNEIMTTLEKIASISTPKSAAEYIRKMRVHLNILQRKLFGDIEKDNSDVEFVCEKIFKEFTKLRSQNQKFLIKIRNSKRSGTLNRDSEMQIRTHIRTPSEQGI